MVGLMLVCVAICYFVYCVLPYKMVVYINHIQIKTQEALIFSRMSRVGHVQNPYQLCWSHDHHISSVER